MDKEISEIIDEATAKALEAHERRQSILKEAALERGGEALAELLERGALQWDEVDEDLVLVGEGLAPIFVSRSGFVAGRYRNDIGWWRGYGCCGEGLAEVLAQARVEYERYKALQKEIFCPLTEEKCVGKRCAWWIGNTYGGGDGCAIKVFVYIADALVPRGR